MDAVLDLTSRAVSFIILIQDTFLKSKQTKVFPEGEYSTDQVLIQFDDIFNISYFELLP